MEAVGDDDAAPGPDPAAVLPRRHGDDLWAAGAIGYELFCQEEDEDKLEVAEEVAEAALKQLPLAMR